MIQTVHLYNDIVNTTKSGTAGFQRASEFNDALHSVQVSLMGLLSPLYATTRAVKDLLAPFIEEVSGSSTIPFPADYFQVAAIEVNSYPADSIEVNQIASLNYLPSRKPDASKNIYAYYQVDNGFVVLPATVSSSRMIYIRKPEDVAIVLTPTSTEDSDYLTPSSTTDLEWPDRAYNLIFYMMLERFGVSQREPLFMEFSKLGIQMEASKL